MKRKDFLKGLGLLGGGVILSKMAKPLEVDAAVTDNMNDSNGIEDTKNDTVTFTSSDDPSVFNSGYLGGQTTYQWNAVDNFTSGEKHASIFHKVSLMFKNIRTLAKLIGTTDISKIGNGTVTNAISNLNTDFIKLNSKLSDKILIESHSDNVSITIPAKGLKDYETNISIYKSNYTLGGVFVDGADGNNWTFLIKDYFCYANKIYLLFFNPIEENIAISKAIYRLVWIKQ